MLCSEFIEGYSEYADGRVDKADEATFDSHMRSCDSCEGYHTVMQRALAECRDLPPVEPSEDFLPRLQHRLYHIDDAGRLTARNHLGSAALVAVASVGFLALSWLPFATQMSVEIELPRVAVQVPGPALPTPSLFRAEPRALSVTDYWVPLSPTLDASPDLFGPGFRSIDGVVRPVALFEPAFVADLESSR